MADDIRRVIISGDVQGVGYRAWAVKTAKSLGLRGWVRNLATGTVEALFAGDKELVARMIEACASAPRGKGLKLVKDRPATYDMLSFVKPNETFSQIADARSALP